MLIHFQLLKGGTIAINPNYVMLVEESQVGTTVILTDGGSTKVQGNYLDVVAKLNVNT
jgi:hypothetical protein